MNLRKSSAVIETYLKSVQSNTPAPYLLPVNSFFPDLESGLVMEFPVGGVDCYCVASSPCGLYIAIGAFGGIVIAKASSGEILKRFRTSSEVEPAIRVVFAPDRRQLSLELRRERL